MVSNATANRYFAKEIIYPHLGHSLKKINNKVQNLTSLNSFLSFSILKKNPALNEKKIDRLQVIT